MSDQRRTIHTLDPGVLLAFRCFRREEDDMWRAAQAAKEALCAARVAHERATEACAKAEEAVRERRDWWARRALEVLGEPAPDPSFEEAFAYDECGGVVIAVRKKAAP